MTKASSTLYRFHLFALLCACLFITLPLKAEEDDLNDKNQELESLKIHIKEAEQELNSANKEKLSLSEELKQHEVRISELAAKISELTLSLKEKKITLESLKKEEQKELSQLENERDILAQQIRSAYMVGRADYIKLLLNQQDPAKVSRVLAYYDYHNRTRIETIQTAVAKLEKLYELEQSIETETAEIVALQQEHEQKINEYSNNREQRQAVLLKLDQFIQKKDVELENLHAAAKELGELLTTLNKEQKSTIEFFEDIPPFQNMRGKMSWPIDGKIVEHFGTPKKGEDLQWNGVVIRANTGDDVKAINNGKVVFADWFKNLGMLIIVDHGNDFMSLYAHNESLLKKQDDWVLAGETIATVGDSGGQSQAGLYFEIRKAGKPVNPSLWCKK